MNFQAFTIKYSPRATPKTQFIQKGSGMESNYKNLASPVASDYEFCVSVFSDATGQIQMISSEDGATWTFNEIVMPNEKANNVVCIPFREMLFLAYTGYDSLSSYLYMAFTSDGSEWTKGKNIIADDMGGNRCAMFAQDLQLGVVYQEENTNKLCLKITNNGDDWSDKIYISPNGLEEIVAQSAPAVTVSDGVVYLIYQDETNHLKLTTSDNGIDWTVPTAVGNMLACNPSLASIDGDIHLTYQPYKDNAVVSDLYYANYGHGSNWSFNPDSIANNIGGYESTLTASDVGLCVLYQEINTQDVYCMQMVYGESWSTPTPIMSDQTIPNLNLTAQNSIYESLTSPGFCGLPYRFLIGQKVNEDDPVIARYDSALITACFPPAVDSDKSDTYFNWTNRALPTDDKAQNKSLYFWGMTGIIAMNSVYFANTGQTLNAGSVIIFPGTLDAHVVNNYNSVYGGQAQFCGVVPATPLARMPIKRVKTEGGNPDSLHKQLCQLYKPNENYTTASITEFMTNFIGFSMQWNSEKGNYVLGYRSRTLNKYWFYRLDAKGEQIWVDVFSKDWEKWLTDFCEKNFPGFKIEPNQRESV